MIRCEICKALLSYWPDYYFGGSPNKPEDAYVYFCGPDHALEYYYTSDKFTKVESNTALEIVKNDNQES